MNQNKHAFKIAVISTAFYLRSHSDVICTRWTHQRPYDKECGWDGPSSTIASIYIEQMTSLWLRRSRAAGPAGAR